MNLHFFPDAVVSSWSTLIVSVSINKFPVKLGKRMFKHVEHNGSVCVCGGGGVTRYM